MAAEWVRRMGRRMAERREELDLYQREVAARLPGNVDAQQISKWERGVHKPSDETLALLAAILKTSVAELMADAPKPGTPDLMGALAKGQDGETQIDRMEQMLRELGEAAQALSADNVRQQQMLEELLDTRRRGGRGGATAR